MGENNDTEGLTAAEVLSRTLDKLLDKFPHQKVESFAHPLYVTVIQDFDREGCMVYRSAAVCAVNGRDWVLALGKNDACYLTERYRADILAVDLPGSEERLKRPAGELADEVASSINESRFFKNSLIVALSDGNFATMQQTRFDNKLERRAKEKIGQNISRFIAQSPEYDQRYILASTLQHPTTKVMLYKEGLVDFLAESFEGILAYPPYRRRFYF